jgi:hypothetical protein
VSTGAGVGAFRAVFFLGEGVLGFAIVGVGLRVGDIMEWSILAAVVSALCAAVSVAVNVWQYRRDTANRRAEAHREKPRLIIPVEPDIISPVLTVENVNALDDIDRIILSYVSPKAVVGAEKNPHIIMVVANAGREVESIHGELDGEPVTFLEMRPNGHQGFMLIYRYDPAKQGKPSTLVLRTRQVSGWDYSQRYEVGYGEWRLALQHTQVLRNPDRSIDF